MSMSDNELIARISRETAELRIEVEALIERTKETEAELKFVKEGADRVTAYIGYCGHIGNVPGILEACYMRVANCPASPVDPNAT